MIRFQKIKHSESFLSLWEFSLFLKSEPHRDIAILCLGPYYYNYDNEEHPMLFKSNKEQQNQKRQRYKFLCESLT